MKKILGALAVVGMLATPAAGQTNLTGKWEMTSITPRGEVTQTITLQHDGATLSGTMQGMGGGMGGQARRGGGAGGGGRGGGMGGPTEIQDGKVEGNTVTFVIVRGMGDRVFESAYRGTLNGDTITGTATTPRGETEFTMVRVAS